MWFRKLLEHTLPVESGQTSESLKFLFMAFILIEWILIFV